MPSLSRAVPIYRRLEIFVLSLLPNARANGRRLRILPPLISSHPNSPKTYTIVPKNSVVDSEILGFTFLLVVGFDFLYGDLVEAVH